MWSKQLFEGTEWYKAIQGYECILVFGTKKNAAKVYKSILRCKKDVECFVVSDERKAGKPAALLKKPVKSFCEISEEWKERGLIVITQNDVDAMGDILRKAGFRNIIAGPSVCSRVAINELSNYYSTPFGRIDLGPAISVSDYCRRPAAGANSSSNVCIYAVTSHLNQHTEIQKYNSKYIKYIQAGSACTEQRICEIRDNEGDSISIQNPYYCELIAGYWIYKNDKAHRYVGLYHYSRGLDLTDQQIERVAADGADMVLPVPVIFGQAVAAATEETLVSVMKEAIQQVSPEYLSDAEKCWTGRVFFPGNIVFAKKEIFDHYYMWMFDVLDKCAKNLEGRNMAVSRRQWGYYAEVLSSIYFQRCAKAHFTLYAPIRELFDT